MFSIKSRQELEDLEELVSLQNQVKDFYLQDNSGKQNYHYDSKKLQEPLIDTIKDTSEIFKKNCKSNLQF